MWFCACVVQESGAVVEGGVAGNNRGSLSLVSVEMSDGLDLVVGFVAHDTVVVVVVVPYW